LYILFDKLKIKGGKKTPSGAWSTDAETLNFLASSGNILPKLLLEWRGLSKLKSTYTDALPNFINKNKITCVVDATHPFAVIISKNLNNACKEIDIPLLLFERKSLINNTNNFFYIDDLKDINNVDLENKNILLAIGSRFLNDTANYYMNCKANVFARVLPTYESITKAFGSCIENSNIAILEPSKNNESILEKKLCDFWEIDYVLCRESGSYSQKNWESIVSGSKMKLFLVKRPKVTNDYSYSFNQYHNLINHIIKKY